MELGRISRSYLFVPANRVERVIKAAASVAHEVIVDLEDAVPLSEKVTARETLRELAIPRPILVRVNNPETKWFQGDLTLCADLKVAGVVIPKTEHPEQLRQLDNCLPEGTWLLPLIETGSGYANLNEICKVPNVQRLIFGTVDFQLDMGIYGDGEELLYFRSALVLASRLAGLQPPIDGVTLEIGNSQRLREDTLRSKRFGFGGKLCIHPNQVSLINECFRPTVDEVAMAKRVVDQAAAAKGGAITVDGKMVDRPVILRAEQILRDIKT